MDESDQPRPYHISEAEVLSETLARAFFEDPVAIYFFPDSEKRSQGLKKFFYIQISKLYGPVGADILTSDPEKCASIWVKPDTKMPALRSLAGLLPMVYYLRKRTFMAGKALGYLESFHPKDPPHYYLATIGVDPRFQGKGLGSDLMRPILNICDSKYIPAYLESSKQANVPFYERHGFKVKKTVYLPYNGPPLYLMWRDPK
jgi:ribosomal protein S18 acetylase RimI-like enzyme